MIVYVYSYAVENTVTVYGNLSVKLGRDFNTVGKLFFKLCSDVISRHKFIENLFKRDYRIFFNFAQSF